MTSQSSSKNQSESWLKRFWKNPDFQTILAHFLPSNPASLPNSRVHHIPLKDQDKLVIKINHPSKGPRKKTLAILVHGMTGSSESKYVVRISRKLHKLGIATARLNLRGAGDGAEFAAKTYNANSHDDIAASLEYIHRLYPDYKIYIAGFSLGGALTLKMLSNHKQVKDFNLVKAVAVCPPIDLVTGIDYLDNRNKKWSLFFAKYLIKDLKPRVCPKTIKTLAENPILSHVDRVYTAPAAGFKSALEYYEKASCIDELENINVDTKIISSLDDPIIDPKPLLTIKEHKHIDIHTTKYGGHLGFLIPHKKGLRYMDHYICEYFDNH